MKRWGSIQDVTVPQFWQHYRLPLSANFPSGRFVSLDKKSNTSTIQKCQIFTYQYITSYTNQVRKKMYIFKAWPTVKSNYSLACTQGSLLTTADGQKQSPITPSPTPLKEQPPTTSIRIIIRPYTDRLVIADYVVRYWLATLWFSSNINSHTLHLNSTHWYFFLCYNSVWPHTPSWTENESKIK